MLEIVELVEWLYVVLCGMVLMSGIVVFVDWLWEVIDWLVVWEIVLNDALFFKYDVVDMEYELTLEIGFLVDDVYLGEGEIVIGVFLVGCYVIVIYYGYFDGLVKVIGDLFGWGVEYGVEWDVDGDNWIVRLEIYRSDLREVLNMDDWVIDL